MTQSVYIENMNKIGGWIGVFAVILFVSFGCGCIEPANNGLSAFDFDEIPVQKPEPVSIISSNYYEGACSVPPDVSIIEMLTMGEWEKQYVRGTWDCSQMSADMECLLERCGFDVLIEMGENPDGEYHAWILIYLPANTNIGGGYTTTNAGYYKYECTGLYFVTPDHTNWDFTAEYQYENIYEIEEHYNQMGWSNFEEEWAWWLN